MNLMSSSTEKWEQALKLTGGKVKRISIDPCVRFMSLYEDASYPDVEGS